MKKRILSLILALSMVLSVLPPGGLCRRLSPRTRHEERLPGQRQWQWLEL